MSYRVNKLLIICICLFVVSCASRKPVKVPPDDEPAPVSSQSNVMEEDEAMYPPEPEETIQPPTPRDLASHRLMEQAMVFLDNNKPDESIRSLEKAVTIAPGRGENYYYLAEAWYMKGNLSQAREYNSLAAIYLKDDMEWMERIEEQKVRIDTTK